MSISESYHGGRGYTSAGLFECTRESQYHIILLLLSVKKKFMKQTFYCTVSFGTFFLRKNRETLI